MRPAAGNAALRPAQNTRRSSSLVETFSVVELFFARFCDTGKQVIHLGFRPVQLDNQQRLDFARIAGMDEVLRGVDGGAVHHFHAAGDDARADNVGDALAGLFAGSKADQRGAGGFGLLQDAHGDFGDDASRPSEPVIRPRRS